MPLLLGAVKTARRPLLQSFHCADQYSAMDSAVDIPCRLQLMADLQLCSALQYMGLCGWRRPAGRSNILSQQIGAHQTEATTRYSPFQRATALIFTCIAVS